MRPQQQSRLSELTEVTSLRDFRLQAHKYSFSSTKSWTNGSQLSLMLVIEDMKKQQKEQHRVTMVIFRKKKKETILKQQQECRRLEREIKLFAKTARAKAACSTVGDTARASTSIVVKLKKSVVNWEALRSSGEKTSNMDSQSGHRVYFDHEEPSFHFYPFTRAEFDTGMRNFEAGLTRGIQSVSMIGNILGWDVYRAPLVTSANSVLQRVQLTKRMCYPLDDILRASYAKDKFLCPMVVLPAGFSLHQRHKVSTKVLQEFDQDSSVFVCNIPGPEKHLRYLYFIRRMQWKFPDGRRKITVSIAVADSTLNQHSRDADEAESVEWATQGGMHISLTEVDKTSVDSVCNRWAGCKTKLHADYMMVQWTQLADLWEETVASRGLLL